MKYDLKKCNNLNFKLASGLSGFIKVSPKGDCYLYQHDKLCDVNAMMQKPRKMQSDITIASELMTSYLLHLKNDIRQ